MGAGKIVVPLIIIGGLATVIFMVIRHDDAILESGCPGHWHTSFDIYVDGKRALFPKPPGGEYALSGREGGKLPFKMHMHEADQGNILHYEPQTAGECQDVEDTFRLLDIEVDRSRLVFSGNHGSVAPGTYAVDEAGNKTLRAFLQTAETQRETTAQGIPYIAFESYRDWEELSMGQLLDIDQLPNFSKLLIVYGDASDDQVRQWQAAIPNPPL